MPQDSKELKQNVWKLHKFSEKVINIATKKVSHLQREGSKLPILFGNSNEDVCERQKTMTSLSSSKALRGAADRDRPETNKMVKILGKKLLGGGLKSTAIL